MSSDDWRRRPFYLAGSDPPSSPPMEPADRVTPGTNPVAPSFSPSLPLPLLRSSHPHPHTPIPLDSFSISPQSSTHSHPHGTPSSLMDGEHRNDFFGFSSMVESRVLPPPVGMMRPALQLPGMIGPPTGILIPARRGREVEDIRRPVTSPGEVSVFAWGPPEPRVYRRSGHSSPGPTVTRQHLHRQTQSSEALHTFQYPPINLQPHSPSHRTPTTPRSFPTSNPYPSASNATARNTRAMRGLNLDDLQHHPGLWKSPSPMSSPENERELYFRPLTGYSSGGGASAGGRMMGGERGSGEETEERGSGGESGREGVRAETSRRMRRKRSTERSVKSTATGMACTFCRKRKIRCDGATPTCHHCAHHNKTCVYEPIPASESLEEKWKRQRMRAAKQAEDMATALMGLRTGEAPAASCVEGQGSSSSASRGEPPTKSSDE